MRRDVFDGMGCLILPGVAHIGLKRTEFSKLPL
jgi:hypothetical protein